MILVAGGTGRLGALVVRRLRADGHAVRVLTRDPARAAGLDVETVTGDVRDPDSLTPAVTGVDVVVSAVHGFLGPRGVSPATVDRAGNIALVDAARAAGADVVLVSVVGAAPDSPFELFRAKHAAEQHLRGPARDWTVVRSAAFLETWQDILRETAARDGRPLVFGRGDNPIDFVSVEEVADAVVRCVLDPRTRGTVVEVEGPEDLTLCELAARVAEERGYVGPPRHVPRPALRLASVTVGLLRPQVRRQTRAALAMDVVPLARHGRKPVAGRAAGP